MLITYTIFLCIPEKPLQTLVELNLLSTFYCLLSTTSYCLMSTLTVYCLVLLSAVHCLLSIVYCLMLD